MSLESGSLQPLGKVKRKRSLDNENNGIVNWIFQECVVTSAQNQGHEGELLMHQRDLEIQNTTEN